MIKIWIEIKYKFLTEIKEIHFVLEYITYDFVPFGLFYNVKLNILMLVFLFAMALRFRTHMWVDLCWYFHPSHFGILRRSRCGHSGHEACLLGEI